MWACDDDHHDNHVGMCWSEGQALLLAASATKISALADCLLQSVHDDEDDDDDDDVDDVDDFCDVDDDGAHDDDFDSSSKCVIVITSLWSIIYARFLAWNLTMTCCVWYMREYQDEETHEDTS